MTHSVERQIEPVEELLRPGRIFSLCAGCFSARHEYHVMPCECDSWNDAQRVNPDQAPWRVPLQLEQLDVCPSCLGTGLKNKRTGEQ